ncbi:MAG: hypothetical protein N3B21_16525 [Clostridia bacterium]|nr:hypothetical protein [Clostridia bacterium]
MDYVHINEKLVSKQDKRNGAVILVDKRKYKVIGFEIITGNFICTELGSR